MGRKRRFGKEFKAKVAREKLPAVFVDTKEKEQDKDKLIEELYKRIGQLNVENEWFKKKLMD